MLYFRRELRTGSTVPVRFCGATSRSTFPFFFGVMLLANLAAALLAFLVASAALPQVIRAARRHRLLDYPDGQRRLHNEPIPRLGSVGIFIGAIVAVFLVVALRVFNGAAVPTLPVILPGLVLGSLVVFVTGIVDDLVGVRPLMKLAAQSVAALAVMGYGFRVDTLTLTGVESLHLNLLALPITFVWIVGLTNAFNLIDGVDGLAGTFVLVGLTACGIVDLLVRGPSVMLVDAALFGGVVAFLRYNKSPARIFLGDSGSLTLGFFLSVRIVTSSTTDDGRTFFMIPLFALAYPIADTLIAIARRWLRGEPFSRADGRHVHHQILALGISPSRTVELLALFFTAIAVAGFSTVFAPQRITLVVNAAALSAVCVAGYFALRWLRYHEFSELGSSMASVVSSARRHVKIKVMARELASKIEAAESLESLQEMLAQAAPDLNLIEISVLPEMPQVHGPDALQISPLAERPYRVDFPMAWTQDGQVREIVLRLWCAKPKSNGHLSSERVAVRLAPSVQRWAERHPEFFDAALAPSHRKSAPKAHLQVEDR